MAEGSGAIEIFAPAKVNLSLRVVGRRADGYHLLDSLVAFAEVGDTLTLEPAETLSLKIVGPMASALEGFAVEDNIVLRAAQALIETSGAGPRGATLTLHKVLPVGGGVGGGSSDAAAALLGLCRLWSLAIPQETLARLALPLGADVPVCLYGKAAHMTGVGETLSALPALPPAWLVLVNPRCPLSTPAVFKARSGPFELPPPSLPSLDSAEALAEALRQRGNGLTEAAISLAPEVATCLKAISETPECLLAQMSGSGSTCWGLFATESAAAKATEALMRKRPGWWVAAAAVR